MTINADRSGRRIPLPDWVRDYRSPWLRADLVAGLTVWAVLIPQSLAYAGIAGLPPVVGLYAAIPALVLYALVGSSRHLVVAPMSATAAISASIAASYAAGSAEDYLRVSVTLSLVVGVLGLLAGVLRLGFLSAFISEPVLKGFIVGLALTILIGQVPALLSVDKPEGRFFETAWRLLLAVPSIDGPTAAVGLLALVGLLGLQRLLPVIPSALVVVALGIGASIVLDLGAHGVKVVGTIPAGLPSVGLPGSSLPQYTELLGAAAGVLLVAFVEGLGAAKTYAVRDGIPIDTRRELAGTGVANLGSGLFGGMVVNGSLSKTAVHGSSGGRTQLANLVAAALTVVSLLLLTGLFEQLPQAVLAAVVIAAISELIDFAALKRLYNVWSATLGHPDGGARADFLSAVAAMLGVLVLDVLPGLLLGVALSLILLLYRASRPYTPRLVRQEGAAGVWVDAERHPDLSLHTRVAVLRVEGALFFANADVVREALLAEVGDEIAALVLDIQAAPSIDVSAADMLDQLARELDDRAVPFFIAGALGQVRDVVGAAGHDHVLSHGSRDVDSAVAAAMVELESRE